MKSPISAVVSRVDSMTDKKELTIFRISRGILLLIHIFITTLRQLALLRQSWPSGHRLGLEDFVTVGSLAVGFEVINWLALHLWIVSLLLGKC